MSDKKFFTIKNNKMTLINRCLKKINEIITSNNQRKLQIEHVPELETNIRILTSCLSITGIQSLKQQQRLIRSILLGFIQGEKDLTYDNFIDQLEIKVNDYFEKPKSKYLILAPINMQFDNPDPFGEMKVLNQDINFSNWKSIAENCEINKYFNESKSIISKPDIKDFYKEFIPIMIEITAKNFFEAFDEATNILTFFRGYMNFSFDRFRVRYFTSGLPKPIGQFLPPPTYGIFDKNGDFKKLAFTTTRYDSYKKATLTFDQLQDLKSKIEIIPQTNESHTYSIWVKAIRKYSEAMEANEERLTFLLFWQVLELLGLKSKQITGGKIINNIKMLIGNNIVLENLIDVVSECRNNLVHEGKYPDNDLMEESMYVKQIVDYVLFKFLDLCEVYRTTKELKYFFSYATMNNKDLALRKKIINKIQETR